MRLNSRLPKLLYMTRYNETVEAQIQAIRDFAETLRLLVTQLERHADFMAESNLPKVETTHWRTARDAAEGLAKFAGAIQKAAIEARMMADLEKMPSGSKSEQEQKPKKLPSKKKPTE